MSIIDEEQDCPRCGHLVEFSDQGPLVSCDGCGVPLIPEHECEHDHCNVWLSIASAADITAEMRAEDLDETWRARMLAALEPQPRGRPVAVA